MENQSLPKILSDTLLQKLQQAEDEYNRTNINVAVGICNDIVECLQNYITSLKKVHNESEQADKSTQRTVSTKPVNRFSYQNLPEKEPIEFLTIGDLTQLVTNPPGDTCSEGTFGKAFAIYGEDFARDIFKILKKSSVPTLQSLSRWCLLGVLENYCENIPASGNNPKFDEGPDPVLFCPIHDSGEARFNDESVYPTTTALSDLVRKFVQDLDLNYLIHILSLVTDCSYPSTSFHTDLFIKEKGLTLSTRNKNWCDDFQSMLNQPGPQQNEPAILYAFARLKRAHCYFVTKQYSLSLEDASAILKIPTNIPSYIKAAAYVFEARSSYKLGQTAQETAQIDSELNKWKAELVYLQFYRTAAKSFANALELMNESEFNTEMHECNIEMMISLHEVLIAQRSECQPKTCCLCWRNTNLRGSHVIPRFVLAKLSYKGEILAGDRLKGPKQVKYRMLCSECEQRFCNWGEDPFCAAFFEKVMHHPSITLKLAHGNWLYYFFASFIWRICLVLKYKASKFSDILAKVPIVSLRRFLLTSEIHNLTTDCFLYLFIDKHVFDEVFCKLSRNKSFGREGINCSFLTDESLFICSFFNFYVVFPIGPIKNAFLIQGPLKRLKFGEGLFLIQEDSQRCMPVFLERFICGEVADEYEIILSNLPEGTYNKMSLKDNSESNSRTSYLPNVIKCLPDNTSVTFSPMFKFGVNLLGGFKVKFPPIDCELGEDSSQRYTLYLCENESGSQLALYRTYSDNTNRIYAFQLSLSSTGEVDHFSICDGLKNVQYVKALLKGNPALEDFLKSLISVMVLSEPPQLNVHFFPEGADKICKLNPDGSLLLPPNFTVIGKPVNLKNATVWLCKIDGLQTIIIVRLFCEIAYDEVPPYDSLAAMQFELDKENIKPLCPPFNVSFDDEVVLKLLHDLHSICIETINLLIDHDFQNCSVVNCLASEMKCLEFFPLDIPPSLENVIILNELGSRSSTGLKFHSWLCSYRMKNKSMLIVLQNWKIASLRFIIAFHFKQSETDPLQISNLVSLPGARYITIFMKMVRDFCPNDFDIVTRNIVLGVQAALKINARIRSIFTAEYDPLMGEPSSSDSNTETKEEFMDPCQATDMTVTLDPLVCLPDGWSLASEELQLPEAYSLVCNPLETPLYTVWLCVYKDVHEFIVVKTKSGIEFVCSSVIVALDFVAARTRSTHSSHLFRFYPFNHLNQDESSFIEDDFLAHETQFQSDDSQFSVLTSCVQILLSQLYQLYNLQVYLPVELQVDMAPDREVELVYPHPFIAGPLHQETPFLKVTCWLCEEGLGMVKWEKKSTKCSFIAALSFEYSGSAIAKLELVDLPMGLQFLAQSNLYLEQNLSYLIATMLKNLCDSYVLEAHMNIKATRKSISTIS